MVLVFGAKFAEMLTNKFLTTCRRCLSPGVLIILSIVIIGLIIFVPMLGVASLVVALPLLGCVIVCGAMAFFTRGVRKDT